MERVAVLAITKNGVRIGRKLKGMFGSWDLHAPEKFSDGAGDTEWFSEPASEKVGRLFGSYDGLVCLFSLGAVIRLVSPHIRDKKTDPAVIVIDDGAGFVIPALSGHIGGANELAREIAARLGAVPVVTTAADVNKTIAVDLVGREMGWTIESDAVTAVSAHMVNGEKVGLYQDAGERDWWKGQMPANVVRFDRLEELAGSDVRAALIISDRIVEAPPVSVVYRPRSLVVGVGVHQDTPAAKILECVRQVLGDRGLSPASIASLASIKKPEDVAGLSEAARELGVPAVHVERERLAQVEAPNPSDVVQAFEGTPSVSEAAAILVSGGELVVEKQKFPPDLTVAVARRGN